MIGYNPFQLSNSDKVLPIVYFIFSRKQILIFKELLVNFQVVKGKLGFEVIQTQRLFYKTLVICSSVMIGYSVPTSKDMN